jgi:protein ImuB
MRIACIHVPQLALQCATRIDPALRGAPVAAIHVGVGERTPAVAACSRAAHAIGVRVGMTAAVARELGATIVALEPAIERDAVRAIADALLALAPRVDLGGRVAGVHHALYAEVPVKTRGHTFGERVVELLASLGIAARVGVADDRFAAWVAAAHGDDPVTTVPRGGSAAFLAPQPLSLLAIAPEVQHMLEALGVSTLGAFAALPAPSVARPTEADYQALARGEAGASLAAYMPDAPIRETILARGGVLARDGEVDCATAIALLAERVALRLAGRGRAAVALEISAGEANAMVTLERSTADAEPLATAIRAAIADVPGRVRVVVTGEVVVGGEAIEVAAPAPVLPVVLSTAGVVDLFTGAAFIGARQASRPPQRARRGKQRRHPRTLPGQSRLDLAASK